MAETVYSLSLLLDQSEYLIAIGSTLIIVESLFWLPWSKLMANLLKGVQRTLLALTLHDIDDEAKEQALRVAAFAMLKVSLQLLLIFACLTGLFLSDFYLEDLFKTEHLPLTVSLGLKTIVSLVYWPCRLYVAKKKADQTESAQSDQAYSKVSQALHEFALAEPQIARLSFDWERKRILTSKQVAHSFADQPIWVCGLARAGTTILTDLLYETGQFASLTYRDMPFPLAPNLWAKLSRFGVGGAEKRVERAHGDGLLVNIDSPEALEEVFWRVHEPQIYQNTSRLLTHRPTEQTCQAFLDYTTLVLNVKDPQKKQRYLSKNNNHLIRLPSILDLFPKALIIVPLRDPFEHAESLRRQHDRWCVRHQEDPFSKNYMTWLAHHEFGADHRPFQFRPNSELNEPEQHHQSVDTTKLSYWLDRWEEAYRFVDSISSERLLIIDYDELNQKPNETLKALFSRINLVASESELKKAAQRFRAAPKRVDRSTVNHQQRQRLEALYRSLYAKSIRS